MLRRSDSQRECVQMKSILAVTCLYVLASNTALAGEPRVARVDEAAEPLTRASVHVGGRALVRSTEGRQTYTHQWPGVYFETAFHGTRAYFTIGPGDVVYIPCYVPHQFENLTDEPMTFICIIPPKPLDADPATRTMTAEVPRIE